MDPFAAQRNQANLRSIARSDPAVQEILETSVYSTIYHFTTPENGGEGEWVKQKAEGPTFIVRRNTSPEHALYMLNRQTVKNVTIPLVKGEMKAIAIGEGMLHVARRGEKLRRGIWFSEPGMVEKFQAEITRVCGPPSKRSPGDPAANSPVMVQPVPQAAGGSGAGNDGFSRLFAGLMTTPSAGSTPPSQPFQPIPAVTQQVQTINTVTATTLPLPFSPSPTAAMATSVTDNGPPPPVPHSTHPPPPPANPFTPPPGQTVDDLLNSILGATSLPPIGQLSTLQQSQPAHGNQPPPADQAPHVPLDSKPEALHLQEKQVGVKADALRTTQAGPLSVSSISERPTGNGVVSSPRLAANHPSHPPRQSDMPNAPFPVPQGINGLPSPSHTSSMPAPSDPLSRSSSALKGSIIDALGGVADLRPAGRAGFAQVLEALIIVCSAIIGQSAVLIHQNEPRFVDDLWEGYLKRMAGG